MDSAIAHQIRFQLELRPAGRTYSAPSHP